MIVLYTYIFHSHYNKNWIANTEIGTGLGSSVGRVSAPRSEVPGSIPGRDIPKSLTMVLVAPRLGTRIFGVGLGLVAPVSV